MNHCYSKIFFLNFLLFVTAATAQTTEQMRVIYCDNHIKKIVVYQADSIGGSRHLSKISVLNDSGLVIKECELNRKGDTTYFSIWGYDQLNREISTLSRFGNNKISDRHFKYIGKRKCLEISNYDSKVSKTRFTYRKVHIGNTSISFRFVNRKFRGITRIKKINNYRYCYFRNFQKPFVPYGRIIDSVDAYNNILRSYSISKYKRIIPKDEYVLDSATSTTQQVKRNKKVTDIIKHDMIYQYKYSDLKLFTEKIAFPPGQTFQNNSTGTSSDEGYFYYEYTTK